MVAPIIADMMNIVHIRIRANDPTTNNCFFCIFYLSTSEVVRLYIPTEKIFGSYALQVNSRPEYQVADVSYTATNSYLEPSLLYIYRRYLLSARLNVNH